MQLARTVYPYVENHNFYVEHWHHSLFWNKVRELGDLFAAPASSRTARTSSTCTAMRSTPRSTT